MGQKQGAAREKASCRASLFKKEGLEKLRAAPALFFGCARCVGSAYDASFALARCLLEDGRKGTEIVAGSGKDFLAQGLQGLVAFTGKPAAKGVGAAGFGQVIAARASISGAEGGCQAEIGSASAMAAAALVSLHGGTPEQMAHACAMALKNLMGLVCDPVAGLVEVPCVKRNVIGAVNAVSAADMALAGIESRVPVDQVIDCMGSVGRRLPVELRETSLGGLAATPFGQSVKAGLEKERRA